ncbi:39S ribosomal protein L19, mitochondrial [Athalia rosae]|uniref:39S ribosomal protein L19, mitochondrial n=1 Tax=Athalia rosae TaxID=37344 RepID=UPI002034863C|nr:39S ribosomal protein L19, mitochondrial [Athalia rosae]
MACVGRAILSLEIRQNFKNFKPPPGRNSLQFSSVPVEDQKQNNNEILKERKDIAPPEFRFLFPEFLPDPNPLMRNSLRERLERMDMMARRAQIDIPPFYVGSIVGVTHSDPSSPGKPIRFVGICIQKSGCGLRANFILRNVVDHQGVEVNYNIYDPTIQKIDCLRLEKRLDDELLYLRDAPLEYSTFSFDMEPEILPEGTPVHINDIKVPLKPRPWLERWERKNLKGIQDLVVTEKQLKKAAAVATPWEKYDLMKTYRNTIPAEDQTDIFAEVYSDLHQLQITRRKSLRKTAFSRPVKKN